METRTLSELLLEAVAIALAALSGAYEVVRPFLHEGAQALADLLAK